MSNENPFCNSLRVLRIMGDITEYLSSKKPFTGSIDKKNVPALQKLYKKIFIDDQIIDRQEKLFLSSIYSQILAELLV